MPKLEKGLVQVYTGNGKGKTTAAFGLALRAIGRGLRVCIIQFIKGGFDYGELYVIDRLPGLKLKAYGRGKFVDGKKPDKTDVDLAEEALATAEKAIKDGECDIVILDEINVALSLKLIKTENVLNLIKKKPAQVELVLTGRNAPSEIVEAADLVTEMVEVKHPYSKGFHARKGIEY
ncbi:MAG: cob(I)yrinic acid a,c-diamide adenosyltransferase [Candidatus Bathyarchaeia archaeon]